MKKERIDHALNVIRNIKVNTTNFCQIQESAATLLHNQLDNVREEICRCICFNFYQAAITLTNHLIESFLRLSVAIKKSGATEYNDESLVKIDDAFNSLSKLTLFPLINLAFDHKIITEDQLKQIEKYFKKIRNPFSHGSPHQLLNNAGKMGMIRTSFSGKTPLKVMEVDNQKQFQLHGLFQGAKASNDAIPYFKYVDELIITYYHKINNI